MGKHKKVEGALESNDDPIIMLNDNRARTNLLTNINFNNDADNNSIGLHLHLKLEWLAPHESIETFREI